MNIYLQEGCAQPAFVEAVVRELRRRGDVVHVFDPDAATIDRLPLEAQTLVLAALWVKLRLLARAGLTDRIAADYPAELSDLLRRRTWSGALEDLIHGPAAAAVCEGRRRATCPGGRVRFSGRRIARR